MGKGITERITLDEISYGVDRFRHMIRSVGHKFNVSEEVLLDRFQHNYRAWPRKYYKAVYYAIFQESGEDE